jgi:hypothetical protein
MKVERKIGLVVISLLIVVVSLSVADTLLAYGTISGTQTITANIPPTDVVISGPTTGMVNTAYTFTATVSPITATQPITYVWRATGQDPMTHTGGLSRTIPFTWSLPGTHTITVTATNVAATVTDTHVITVKQMIYLPLILNCWPPVPVLNPIANGGDGNYIVSWNPPPSGGTYTYTLQEDDDPTFSSPHIYPSQSTRSIVVIGRVCGTYYYRVKATNDQGVTPWSNTEAADVTHLTIDDFDDGKDPNTIGGPISRGRPSGCAMTLFSDYVADGSGYAYYISYNVTPVCYAIWETGLLGKDFSGFSTLTFQIWGALGNEQPNIYLQDASDERHYVDIEDFHQVTTYRQQARIPLDIFEAQGANLEALNFFQIVFEWEYTSSTIYVDEIRFECSTFAGASY